ncbi:MAG: ferritin-like domain-containing protein [Acidobacteriota bacterium]|nr:ferritin-like domain-containing protein [Acidobacteriota bacterium]
MKKINLNSRRGFLAGSAGALGGVAAANLMAQSGGGTGTAVSTPTDLDVLMFALRLERLEAAFYAQGLAKLSATDFGKAQFASSLSSSQSNSLYANFQAIRDHEQAHVMQITAALNTLGATLPAQDTYTFSPNGVDTTTFANADSFIQVADVLENTGTSAYDGAIRFVTNPDLRQAAATIATVESRHAAYLNELTGKSPFPAANDSPLTMDQVLAMIKTFLTNANAAAPISPTIDLTPRSFSTSTTTIPLDASASVAANGGTLRYIWENTLGGPYVKFSDPNSPTPMITFLNGPGLYTLLLSVIDSAGNASSLEIKITYSGT